MAGIIHVAVLAGTTRQQRKSIDAARLIERIGRQRADVSVELADPRQFDFKGDGNDPESKDARYTAVVERAEAFFIVVPEYNHSFPGSLKRMLDSELELYRHKPVAFAGVSSGMVGGARAIEALVGPVREMGLVATFSDVYFPRVQEAFDGHGQPVDEAAHRGRIEVAYDELVWMARTLKYGRGHIASDYHPGGA